MTSTNRSNWPDTPLAAICSPREYSFVGGPFGSDLTSKDYVSEPGVPVIRGVNLGGSESRFIEENFVYVSNNKADALHRNTAYRGDLVFTQRGTLGQAALIPEDASFQRYVISQSQMKLTVDRSKADPRYVYYAFRAPKLQSKLLARTQATGVPHINLGILKEFTIPLPPLTEQKRIADILDKADAIRRKRQQSRRHLVELIDAKFFDVFGDPLTNPRNWTSGTFDDQLTLVQYGPRFYNEAYSVDGVRIVRITDLDFQGRVDYPAMPRMDVSDDDRKKFCLRPGDLLLARSGATVGKTALIDEETPECIAGAYFIRLRFTKKVHPLFAQMVLRSLPVQTIIAEKSKQSAQQNFNGPAIRALPLPVPPVELQHEFAEFHRHALKAGKRLADAAGQVDFLFDSLVQRAFKGEL